MRFGGPRTSAGVVAGLMLSLAFLAGSVRAEGGPKSAWTELTGLRDSIARDVESGKLGEIHEKAERLPALGQALVAGAKGLPGEKRTRIEATLGKLPKLADSLHDAADGGNAEATRRELKRLDGLVELVRVQFPAEALAKVPAPAAEGEGEHPKEEKKGDNSHAMRPLASVDEPGQSRT